MVQAPVQRYLATATHAPLDPPYDVVLLDPPYAFGEAELSADLAALDGGTLAPGALVVVERDAHAARAGVAGGLGRRGRYAATAGRRSGRPLLGCARDAPAPSARAASTR